MPKVLVILSGGQDSTTTLCWAKEQFKEVHAITFNYGQRHALELEAAKKVAEMVGVASHEIVDLGPILKGTSPLVNPSRKVAKYASSQELPGGLEDTYVPARNLLFLTIAANRAYVLGIHNLAMGVCQADFGGYPDCRQRFIDLAAATIADGVYGSEHSFLIHTPLMDLTKAESVKLAHGIPGCWDALAYTHTCYDGQYPPNPNNHASLLRARGFREAGLPDPLIQRAKAEGKLPADYPDDGLVEGTAYEPVMAETPAPAKDEDPEA